MATVVQPASVADADAIISAKSCVINFCAEWCEPCGHMNMVFEELAKEHTALCFMQVDADGLPDLCDRYGLESVPAFLFFHGGALVDTLLGADAPALTSKAKQHSLTASIHSGTRGAPGALNSGSIKQDWLSKGVMRKCCRTRRAPRFGRVRRLVRLSSGISDRM